MSREERIKMEEISLKARVSRSYLTNGATDTAFTEMNSCTGELMKALICREELASIP
jgi:hypothetical protein